MKKGSNKSGGKRQCADILEREEEREERASGGIEIHEHWLLRQTKDGPRAVSSTRVPAVASNWVLTQPSVVARFRPQAASVLSLISHTPRSGGSRNASRAAVSDHRQSAALNCRSAAPQLYHRPCHSVTIVCGKGGHNIKSDMDRHKMRRPLPWFALMLPTPLPQLYVQEP